MKNNIHAGSLVSFSTELFICGNNTKNIHTSIIFQVQIHPPLTKELENKLLQLNSNQGYGAREMLQ